MGQTAGSDVRRKYIREIAGVDGRVSKQFYKLVISR